MYMFGFRIPALTCVKRPTVQVSFWTTKYHISIDSTRMSTALHICRQLPLVMVCISPAVSHSVHSSHPWGSPNSTRPLHDATRETLHLISCLSTMSPCELAQTSSSTVLSWQILDSTNLYPVLSSRTTTLRCFFSTEEIRPTSAKAISKYVSISQSKWLTTES